MALLRLYTFADHGYRNISMRHWNETQPGGQGLLNDFENYFKALSDTDKEVLKVAQTAAVSSYLIVAALAHDLLTTEEAQNGCQKGH
jgi:hypothetical protein